MKIWRSPQLIPKNNDYALGYLHSNANNSRFYDIVHFNIEMKQWFITNDTLLIGEEYELIAWCYLPNPPEIVTDVAIINGVFGKIERILEKND
jgi:hypothetical protein